jgi:hypothetical protein
MTALRPSHIAGNSDKPEADVDLLLVEEGRRVRELGQSPVVLWARTDLTIGAVLLVIGVVGPAVAAACLHSLDIPRNDSWSYLRTFWGFIHTGHVELFDWSGMTFVGQVVWAAPFAILSGNAPWAPEAAVAVASAFGIAAAYRAARALLTPLWAAACVMVTLAVPGFLVNTTSFMTDLPAFAAQVLCLGLGMAAMRRAGRARTAFTVAALAVGCFGFSIREFDLAAPVAVLAVLAAQDRLRWRTYAVEAASVLVVCAAIYEWTARLPGAHLESLTVPGLSQFKEIVASYFTLSLVLSPLLPAMLRGRLPALRTRAAIAAAASLALGIVSVALGWLFVGNYLQQNGSIGVALLSGVRPALFPGPIWLALQVIAVVSGTVLAFVAVGSVRNRQQVAELMLEGSTRSLIAWFAALSAAGLIVYACFVQAPLFDRYLGPVAFPTAVLLAWGRPRTIVRQVPSHWSRGPKAATVALALIVGAVIAALTLNSDAYDGARWQAGDLLVQAGYSPLQEDAGFEWVAYHSGDPADRDRKVIGAPGFFTWYDRMFPDLQDCAYVSSLPWVNPNLHLLAIRTYDALGFVEPEQLRVYAVLVPGCPVPRSVPSN